MEYHPGILNEGNAAPPASKRKASGGKTTIYTENTTMASDIYVGTSCSLCNGKGKMKGAMCWHCRGIGKHKGAIHGIQGTTADNESMRLPKK
tara:strand:+ start:10519 stop:10794 length:276 start_codon:yes stop_codon:yes gene_type:complete